MGITSIYYITSMMEWDMCCFVSSVAHLHTVFTTITLNWILTFLFVCVEGRGRHVFGPKKVHNIRQPDTGTILIDSSWETTMKVQSTKQVVSGL